MPGGGAIVDVGAAIQRPHYAGIRFLRLPALTIATLLSSVNVAASQSICAGDCDDSVAVTVDELVVLVSVALGSSALDACGSGDVDGDGDVTVDEVVVALQNALNGCPLVDDDDCGNEVVDDDEECDDGGICIGGPLAGTSCTSEAECLAGGACFGGPDDLRACERHEDCRLGACRRCRPFGGDGCAANCTEETAVPVELVAGVGSMDNTNHHLQLEPGTSGFGYFMPFFYGALPISGNLAWIAGRPTGGVTPVVMKSSDFMLGPRFVTLGCECLQLPAASTCGGTAFEVDGTPSLDCTPEFSGADLCPAHRPCAPVHGNGNGASGFIRCGGMAVASEVALDCNDPKPPQQTTVVATEGGSEVGQALITFSPAIGHSATCFTPLPEHGADGEFCTDDDVGVARGRPGPLVFTTDTATGLIVEGFRGGPFTVEGKPFPCEADGSVNVGDGGIVAAYTECRAFGNHTVSPRALFWETAHPSPP